MKNINGFVQKHKKAITRVLVGGAVLGVITLLYKALTKDEDEEVGLLSFDEAVDVAYESIPVSE